MNPLKLDDITKLLKDTVADRLADCPPGTDMADVAEGSPLPYCVMQAWDGSLEFIIIDPAYMEDAETKENLVAKLRGHILAHRASAVGLFSPVWIAPLSIPLGEKKSDAEMAEIARQHRDSLPNRLGDYAGRKEGAMLWSVSQFSKMTECAPIIRSADAAPTLGAWMEMLHTVENRFLDRLQQSVIAVA